MNKTARSLVKATVWLAAIELAARCLYSPPWYQSLEESSGAYNLEYPLNSLNLRGPNVGPKKSGTRHVMILGDSFTFGAGVKFEDTFPALLNAEADGPLPLEFVNAGVRGSTGDWLEVWDSAADTVDPDAVVAVFSLGVYGFFDSIQADFTHRNNESRVYQTSHLFRIVRDLLDARRIPTYTEGVARSYLGDVDGEWRKAKENILKLRRLVEKRGAKFGVVLYPVLAGLKGNYTFLSGLNGGWPILAGLKGRILFQDAYSAVGLFSSDHGIETYGILHDFSGLEASDLWVSLADPHPNAAAHRIVAGSVCPFILDLLKIGQGYEKRCTSYQPPNKPLGRNKNKNW